MPLSVLQTDYYDTFLSTALSYYPKRTAEENKEHSSCSTSSGLRLSPGPEASWPHWRTRGTRPRGRCRRCPYSETSASVVSCFCFNQSRSVHTPMKVYTGWARNKRIAKESPIPKATKLKFFIHHMCVKHSKGDP